MGTSTSTGTLTAGQSRTFNLAPASAVTLTLLPNARVTITESPAAVTATGLGGNATRVHEPRLPGSFTYGPYPMGGSVVVENVLRAMRGQSLSEGFDGHANCFVESGFGKALLIDFNYDVEPLPGKFPLPVLGPMSLLKESRLNHWGKLAFRWVYWNALLPGRPIPISERMSMAGKIQPDLAQTKSA